MIKLFDNVHLITRCEDRFYSLLRPMNLEILALKHDLKPAVRLFVDEKNGDMMRRELRECPCYVEKSSQLFFDKDVKLSKNQNGKRILYLSKSKEVIRDLVRYDNASPFKNSREIGELLGYPPCCIESYCGTAARSYSGYITSVHKKTRTFHFILNILDSNLSMISHYPCRFDCSASILYGEKLLKCLKLEEKDKCKKLAGYLKSNFVYLPSAGGYIRFAGLSTRNDNAAGPSVIVSLAGHNLDHDDKNDAVAKLVPAMRAFPWTHSNLTNIRSMRRFLDRRALLFHFN